MAESTGQFLELTDLDIQHRTRNPTDQRALRLSLKSACRAVTALVSMRINIGAGPAAQPAAWPRELNCDRATHDRRGPPS